MKVRTLFGLAGCCALIATASANGEFNGLSTEGYNTVIGGNARTIWRVYANFSHPDEGLPFWGAHETDLTLQTFAGEPNAPVSGSFFAGGNIMPPTSYEISNNPNAAHRSFYTIGLGTLDSNPDPTLYPLLMPGMPTITGNNVTAPNFSAAVATAPDAPFALAGWSGQNRVLLMQLQVTGGNHVRGTMGMYLLPSQTIVVATFNSAIPVPGALGLLALAASIGSRRRRK